MQHLSTKFSSNDRAPRKLEAGNWQRRLWYRVIFLIGLSACAPKTHPYDCGPIIKGKDAEKGFSPLLKFIDIKSGDTFADVGASSGALTVAMSSLLTGVNVYVEDIDTTCLRQDNLQKILEYCSIESGRDLQKVNQYHLTIGTLYHTNLPDHSFDRIYTNATIHVFQSPDSILHDLSKKLKPNGLLFVRDGFKGDHGAGDFCSDPKCHKRLFSIDEFLILMKQNGFKLIRRSPDISGYPVFGFSL